MQCVQCDRDGPPVMSHVMDYRVISFQKKNQGARSFLTPYMVSCSIPNTAHPPEAVSLVPLETWKQRACLKKELYTPTNCLKVHMNKKG